MPEDPLSPSIHSATASANASSIAIRIDEAAWLKALPYLETLATEVCADTLMRVFGAAAGAWPEVSLVFSNDEFIRNLNASYRGKDSATNVLSFPADNLIDDMQAADGEILLGDVVMAFETTRSEAVAQEKPLADHVAHLLVHGVLHLSGCDHESEKEATRMEALETAILADLGIRDPYTEFGSGTDVMGARAHV